MEKQTDSAFILKRSIQLKTVNKNTKKLKQTNFKKPFFSSWQK